jgi:hypothetical protein
MIGGSSFKVLAFPVCDLIHLLTDRVSFEVSSADCSTCTLMRVSADADQESQQALGSMSQEVFSLIRTSPMSLDVEPTWRRLGIYDLVLLITYRPSGTTHHTRTIPSKELHCFLS